jgi:hypothetical protein
MVSEKEEDAVLNRRAAWVLVGVGLRLPAMVQAQTMISVGDCRTAPGTTVTVPVDVIAQSPLAALNVRLRFDPALLSLAGVSGGALLSPSHEVHYSTPADGKVNIVVYAPAGAAPFTASSGTAVVLTFAPGPRAGIGNVTEIRFDVGTTPRLPSSDLSDLTGASVPHTADAGLVVFITTARNWPLYE